MLNSFAVRAIAQRIKCTAEMIDSYTAGVDEVNENETGSAVQEQFQNMVFDEIEHLQQLTLVLTQVVAEEFAPASAENADDGGSVFGPGELNAKKDGEFDVEHPETTEDDG